MIALLHITENGQRIACKLHENMPDSKIFDLGEKGRLKVWVQENFHVFTGHIFIMSMGIVYRMIAPYIIDKYQDPAVVVVDDACRFAIAALSGHEGGANNLAFKTAAFLDCEPVVTTASDTNRNITMGVGCRRGITQQAVEKCVVDVLARNSLMPEDIRLAASVDIKRDERGLLQAFEAMSIPLIFLDSGRIRNFAGSQNISLVASKHLNLPGVSEPCCLLLGRRATLIQPKIAIDGVTLALAREAL